MRCFKRDDGELVCVDCSSQRVISFQGETTRLLDSDEFYDLLTELINNSTELEVEIVKTGWLHDRVYYTIYKVSGKFILEIYDGSSATYSYTFFSLP
jgi:hypothetical protein